MSNYTQVTFFAPKDALLSGDPNKIIHGTQVDPELSAIAVAIASKFDTANMGSITQLAIGSGAVGAPSYSFAADTTTGWYLAAVGVLAAATSGVQRGTINGSGAWTINAPSINTNSLVVNGPTGNTSNTYVASIASGTTASFSSGLLVSGGTNASDNALLVRNAAANTNFLLIAGDGHGTLGPNGSLGLSWSTVGKVQVAAPSSGDSMQIVSLDGNRSLISGVTGATNNPRLFISHTESSGTTNLDFEASGATVAGNIQVAGTTVVAITSARNVTINAPSSGIAVTVNGLVNNNSLLISDGTQQFNVRTSAGNVFAGALSNHTYNLLANNLVAIAIAAAGNVTVNAPSSGVALTITGSGGAIAMQVNGAAVSRVAVFDSTNANGSFVGFSNSGTEYADIGTAKNIVTSGLSAGNLSDLAIGNSSTNSVVISTNAVGRFQVSGSGNVTINAPSANPPLTINTFAGSGYGIQINLGSGAPGVLQATGTVAGAYFSVIDGQTGNRNYIFGVGRNATGVFAIDDATAATTNILKIAPATHSNALVLASTGSTMAAPTSGVTLALTGIAGNNLFTVSDGTINGFWGSVSTTKLIFGVSTNHGLSLYTNNIETLKLTNGQAIQGLGPVAAAMVDMTPDSSSWTSTLSGGFSSNPSGTIKWQRRGNLVTLTCDAAITGTSTAVTDISCSGLPAAITPTVNRGPVVCTFNNLGVTGYVGGATVQTGGTILLQLMAVGNAQVSSGQWGSSSTKGLSAGWTITYPI